MDLINTKVCEAKGYRRQNPVASSCYLVPGPRMRTRLICNGCGYLLSSKYQDEETVWQNHLLRRENVDVPKMQSPMALHQTGQRRQVLDPSLHNFITDNGFMRARHIEFVHPVGGMVELYVRRAFHMCNHQRLYCFDIASIAIEHRGRGVFSELLTSLEEYLCDIKEDTPEAAPRFDALFIESIVNPRLTEYLRGRPGYRLFSQMPDEPLAPYNAYFRLYHTTGLVTGEWIRGGV